MPWQARNLALRNAWAWNVRVCVRGVLPGPTRPSATFGIIPIKNRGQSSPGQIDLEYTIGGARADVS